MESDYTRYSLTQGRIVSLGSLHQTETGHTVVYDVVDIEVEELLHLIGTVSTITE